MVNVVTRLSDPRILTLLCLCILLGCSKKEEKSFPKTGRSDFPALELKDTTIIQMFEESKKAWVLKTGYMKKSMEEEVLHARPVNMIIYDSLGKETAWLDADSGAADEDVTRLNVWGNVYARARDGAAVWTDSLIWQKRTGDIRTDCFVKVVSEEGDTLTGDGFVSDDKLENWQILNNVRTVIPNIEQRLDEDTVEYEEYEEEVYDTIFVTDTTLPVEE